MFDQSCWVGVSVNVYTVHYGYWALKEIPDVQSNECFSEIWILKVLEQPRYLDGEYCLIDYLLESILRGEGLWSRVTCALYIIRTWKLCSIY